MPALSAADLAILNGYQYPGGVNAAAVINNIQAGSGTTTSYRHNGFMVYHRTFAGRVTFFYSYDNAVPGAAVNAFLLGIGYHHSGNNVYRLERGYVYGGRTSLSVNIGGTVTEWSSNL